MSGERLIRRVATAVTILCVAAVVLTIAAIAFPTLRSRLGLVPATAPSYLVGDRIDLPANLYDASSVTVLVFIRGNCPSCQRSQPAFKSIADGLQDTPARMLVVVNQTRAEAELQYTTVLGLAAANLVAVDFAALRLRAVPTTVVVNRLGEVLFALEGPPNDQQRDEVLRLARGPVQAG